MHHYLTKYRNSENNLVVESWIQLNWFKYCFVFSDKKLILKKSSEDDLIN